MTTAYVALGGNMGDRMRNLSDALQRLAHVPQTHVEKVSNAYESVPAYVEDQPRFLNAVAEVETGLEADALLGYLMDIEADMGRVRERDNGPRVIDLDLLLFGEEEWNSETLTLPHPGIAERDFVVTPLLEIAPRITLPDGTHVRRANATVGTVVNDVGPIPDIDSVHGVPIEQTEWVVVAESESHADVIVGFDAEIQLKHEVLVEEGIPVAWDPHEPGAEIDPFGMTVNFRLLVPERDAERARELIAAVEAAPVHFPEDAPAL